MELIQMNQICEGELWAPVVRGRVETITTWLSNMGVKYELNTSNGLTSLIIKYKGRFYPVPNGYWIIFDQDDELHVRSPHLMRKLLEQGGMGTTIPFDN